METQKLPVAEHRGINIYPNDGPIYRFVASRNDAEFLGFSIGHVVDKIDVYFDGHCQPRPHESSAPWSGGFCENN